MSLFPNKPHMPGLLLYLVIIFIVFAGSGCVFLGSRFLPPQNINKVYYGSRSSIKIIGDSDFHNFWRVPLVLLDLPFTFSADTLILPFDVKELFILPPSTDPLADWKKICEVKFNHGRRDFHPAGINIDQALSEGVESFLKSRHVSTEDFERINNPEKMHASWVAYYQDSSGLYSAKIIANQGIDHCDYVFIVFFDKSLKAKKVVRYIYTYYNRIG